MTSNCYSFFVVTSLSLVCCFSSFAQNKFSYEFEKIQQSEDVQEYEVALYNTATDFEDESQLLVQIRIANDQLQFIKAKGGQFQAGFEVTVIIQDTAKTEIDRKTWVEQITARDIDTANSVDLHRLTQRSFFLTPGVYRFVITLRDQETGRTGTRSGSVTLLDFSGDSFMLGNVVFLDATSLARTFEVLLSQNGADGRAADGISQKYAYFEIYNVPREDSVGIHYRIFGSKDSTLQAAESRVASSGRITQQYFPLSEAAISSEIRLRVEVFSSGDTLTVETTTSPFLAGPPPLIPNLAERIEVLVYIAESDELKRLKEAEGEEQTAEFKRFWQKRDPTPDTPENEYFDEYYRRVEFANENFESGRHGWRTDMGMVFIILGRPDLIEKPYGYDRYNDFSFQNKPPLIWQYYDLQRRVIFLYRGGDYRIENHAELTGLLRNGMRF